MAQLLRFAASSRRRPDPLLTPNPHRAALARLIDDLQILTLRRPIAVTICASVARHYANRFRKRGA